MLYACDVYYCINTYNICVYTHIYYCIHIYVYVLQVLSRRGPCSNLGFRKRPLGAIWETKAMVLKHFFFYSESTFPSKILHVTKVDKR